MVGQNFKTYGIQITCKCISKYTIYYASKQNLVQICKKILGKIIEWLSRNWETYIKMSPKKPQIATQLGETWIEKNRFSVVAINYTKIKNHQLKLTSIIYVGITVKFPVHLLISMVSTHALLIKIKIYKDFG